MIKVRYEGITYSFKYAYQVEDFIIYIKYLKKKKVKETNGN